MEYLQHPLRESRETSLAEGPYCRNADWWKDSDYKYEEKANRPVCVLQSRYYKIRRTHKSWSIVVISSEVVEKVARKEALKQEFQRLAKQWQTQTSFHSSLGEVFLNEAYQRIMAMGPDALPWIFEDLQQNPRHWFYALSKIVGRDVAEGANNFKEARAMWLEYGRDERYIKST